jgi:hypothetical protein
LGGTRTPKVSPSGGLPPRRSASAFSASQRVPRMVRESRRRGSPGARGISTSTLHAPWSIWVIPPVPRDLRVPIPSPFSW